MENQPSEQKGMRFSPHRTTSHVYCCATGCKKSACKNPTLRFHCLPKSGEKMKRKNAFGQDEWIDRRLVWMKLLKVRKDVSPTAKVCSLHFTKDDYFFPDLPARSRVLKKTAVPSLNLPANNNNNNHHQNKTEVAEKRAQRTKDRSLKRNLLLDIQIQNKRTRDEHEESWEEVVVNQVESNGVDIADSECSDVSSNRVNISDHSYSSVKEIVYKNDDSVNTNKVTVNSTDSSTNKSVEESKKDDIVGFMINIADLKTFKDTAVQVEFERYTVFIKNEQHLYIMTGLPNFSILDALEKIVRVVVPNADSQFCRVTSKLTIKDRIVLTFIKLKQNISYSMLGVMFQVGSLVSCRKIFERMIHVLNTGLKFAVYWPSKEEVMKCIPPSFDDFPNVRAVVDVIEINAQKPQNFGSDTETNSSENSMFVIKFMTAMSPAGMITYISKPFFGKISERAIFEKSNFIENLEKDDALMTDKGFLIENVCSKFGVQLIRPPFFKNKSQLSEEKALLNEKIATARLPMKKNNHRIKNFKVFNTQLPSFLVPKIEQVFFIICAVLNLSSSVIVESEPNETNEI